MIEYIIPENIDERILTKAVSVLKEGGLVCLPTDTNWVVVADPFHKRGLDALYRLKGEDRSKHYSLLCDSISRASDVAFIDDPVYRILKRVVPGHYTFIFEALKPITRALKASKSDHQVGLRFIPSLLVNRLIELLGHVLISTHISAELVLPPEGLELYGLLIEEQLGGKVDLILDPGELNFVGNSTIISFLSGQAELVREGTGDLAPFGLS